MLLDPGRERVADSPTAPYGVPWPDLGPDHGATSMGRFARSAGIPLCPS